MNINVRKFVKRASIMVPLLVLIGVLVGKEHTSPIGKLIASIADTPFQVCLAGGAIFVVVVAGVLWMFAALIPKKPRNNGARKIAVLAISIGLSQLIVMLPSQAATSEVVAVGKNSVLAKHAVVTVVSADASVTLTKEEQAQVDQAVQAELDRLAFTNFLFGTMDYETEMVIPVSCGFVIIITVAVIAGVIYVGYKIYKACVAIGNKKKKEVEDEGDGTNSVQRTSYSLENNSVSSASGTWAALFYNGNVPQLDVDGTDCDYQPPFSFTTTGTSRLTAYLPTGTVSLDSFLTSHGLSTNLTANSYSENGVPTNTPSVITYDSGVVTVAFAGQTNVTTIIECSTNLVDWERIGTFSAPAGAHITVGNSMTSRCRNTVYHRVRVQ